nr:MAG TPA: hypothetical protein [Bacteriophage sp.]DAF40939.1 MAG TPA: hypothetical protein [Bacteriophage sp.]DAV79624.1 MAG TPA: hypothetical protein [Bacteriophage sp.]
MLLSRSLMRLYPIFNYQMNILLSNGFKHEYGRNTQFEFRQ